MGTSKERIKKRNREMVDRSDLVVFFVERQTGGAYQTLCYAEKCGKYNINLANESEAITNLCYQ